MNPEEIKAARRLLIREEELRLKPYQDHLGNWTIGVGRLIGKDLRNFTISEATANQMLIEDMFIAHTAIERIYGRERVEKMGTPRMVALLSMAFQLGEKGLLGFTKMNQAIRNNDWPLAAKEGLDSVWAQSQTPRRAKRMMQILEHNNFEVYDV